MQGDKIYVWAKNTIVELYSLSKWIIMGLSTKMNIIKKSQVCSQFWMDIAHTWLPVLKLDDHLRHGLPDLHLSQRSERCPIVSSTCLSSPHSDFFRFSVLYGRVMILRSLHDCLEQGWSDKNDDAEDNILVWYKFDVGVVPKPVGVTIQSFL